MLKFEITDEEQARYEKWNEEHLKKKHPTPRSRYAGAAGGRLSFMFTPTGIGTFITVVCGLCKEQINITDVSHM